MVAWRKSQQLLESAFFWRGSGSESRKVPLRRGRCPCPRPRGGHPIDPDRDDDGDGDDTAVLAHLHIGRIDPQIGPIAVDRAVSCRGEREPAVTSTASLDETMFEAPLSRLRKVAYVPDVELARRFRTALYQETHLVAERVFADRILNLLEVAHPLTINREE
jgi:hypothetical protein